MTQIVTANRLRDGLVVFLSADGEWSERIEDAAGAMNESGASELMATANQSEIDCHVVGPYLVEVDVSTDGSRPVLHRELVRASGPGVQTELNQRAHGGQT